MNLSDRKKKILSAVVDESIKTAKPVGSKDIQEKYLQDFSSATIRNELSALEDMGFLTQPHTSAGRLPTTEGYKMYVEELMKLKSLSKKEADFIKDAFDEKLITLNDIMQNTAKTISDITNYASVVYFGLTDDAVIEKIFLMKVRPTSTLVVVSTDLGIIKEETNHIVASDEELRQASKILSSLFSGKSLQEITNSENIITDELLRYRNIFQTIVDIIANRDNDKSKNMTVAGKEKLLNYPEYHDIGKLKGALSLLEDEESLYPLISSNPNLEINIKIGGEETGINDCSVVSATYKLNGKPIGSAGVIGPVRMDYGKVVSILKNVTNMLEDSISDSKEDK
ncbi:MAG: heat-inducible transcription repressor HrcA [Clostridia bacterium]|nr:heat-inducible transcription repressor HrcA [Clostridia bacterium]